MLNYTIQMDNAPGPNIYSPDLVLFAILDPIFTKIEESDRVYVRGSEEYITILVIVTLSVIIE